MFKSADILKKLEGMLLENEIPAVLQPKEETGLPVDMLKTEHRGFGSTSNLAEGEFTFLETKEGDANVFHCRIKIASGLTDESIVLAGVQMAGVNSGLPLGVFAYDPYDDSLIYRMDVPFVNSMSEEAALEQADSAVALSLSVAEGYCRSVLDGLRKDSSR